VSRVTRDQLVAVTLLKWMRHLVEAYRGPEDFGRFKQYLAEILNEKNFKADAILADAATEIL